MGDSKRDGARVSRMRLGDEIVAVVSFPCVPAVLPFGLTVAEREVTRLVLESHSAREIAAARGTSERTVANQLASIFRKLGVSSCAELVRSCFGQRDQG